MVTALDIQDMDINEDGADTDGHTTTDDLDVAIRLPPGHERQEKFNAMDRKLKERQGRS